MLNIIKNKWVRVAAVLVAVGMLIYGARKLDQATNGPELIAYTVVDKLQGYSYYKSDKTQINYLLVKDASGTLDSKQVSIAVHHSAKIGDVLQFRNPKNNDAWFGIAIGILLLSFILYAFWLFLGAIFPNTPEDSQ